jgi:hypothetical protein
MEYHSEIKPGTLTRNEGGQSQYGASVISRDFGDKRLFPDVTSLIAIRDYWSTEQLNSERSSRAVDEIQKILGRVVFEIAARNSEEQREVAALDNVLQMDVNRSNDQQTAEGSHLHTS